MADDITSSCSAQEETYSEDDRDGFKESQTPYQVYTVNNNEEYCVTLEKNKCLKLSLDLMLKRLKDYHNTHVYPRSCKLLERKLTRSRVEFLKKTLEQAKTDYFADCAQLESRRTEVEGLRRSIYSHTLGLLMMSHNALKARSVKEKITQSLVSAEGQLKEVKGAFVREAQQYIFPLEVESVTIDDEGETSVRSSKPVVNLNVDIELEGEWLLSGHTKLPTPRITINSVPLPIDGDYIDYHSSSQSDSEHSDAVRISAGLCHVAQFTWLLQQILHTPLPYPLSAVTAIRNYGRSDVSHRTFTKMVSRLDSNILFLCMSQNVSPSALSRRGEGTISNLFNLVTHQDIGCSSSFTCYPELFESDHVSTDYLTASVIEQRPPVLFAVSPNSSDVQEDDVPSDPNSLEWGTLHTSLKQEFVCDVEEPGSTRTPLATSQSDHVGMASTSGRVLAGVSTLWTSVSKYWGK